MDRKENIILTAKSLFAKENFSNVSMQEIADACGITKSSLYYFFENKQDLYICVITHSFIKLNDKLQTILKKKVDVTEKFYQSIKIYLDFGLKEASLARLALSSFSSFESKSSKELNNMKNAMFSYFELLISEAHNQNRIKLNNHKLSAALLVGSMNSLILSAAYGSQENWSNKEVAKYISEIFS